MQVQRPIHAVVFDAGETLLNLDVPAIVRACADPAVDDQAVLRALVATRRDLDAFFLPQLAAKRYPAQAQYADGRGMRLADLLLDHLGVDPARKRAAADELLALDRALRLWCVLASDARATLEALRARGLRLAVVSNSDGHIEWKLDEVGLRPLLHAVLDSHLEGVSKPDPEIFRRALERLDVDPARTLYVGDLYSIDVVAAGHAGMQGVLLDRVGTYETPPCPRVKALADLLHLV